ncbi:MAG: Txe/YoeB family addiction module toxin [Defluviitaleaceae bacterium]|nr:Txe/YoeB family addiction module toxin [Defluviitaleaceae bacterium]
MYHIVYSRQSLKDKDKLKATHLYNKAKRLIDIIKINPFQNPPPYEKLTGDLNGLYSRRINRKHRIWYSVESENQIVRVIRMWTHYE